MDSGFALLTPDEQREYLRILEKMATKQPVVTPATGGMSEAAKRQRAISDDNGGEFSELQDSFKLLDSGDWERVLDPTAVPLPPGRWLSDQVHSHRSLVLKQTEPGNTWQIRYAQKAYPHLGSGGKQ